MQFPKVIFAITLLLATVCMAADHGEGKPAPTDKCPVCGMFVAKFPDFVARLVFEDGSSDYFDGVKDMMKYYHNPGAYEPAKTARKIASIQVTDYYALKPVDGRQAYYVIGSEVFGPMGKELIPFQEESAAREFVKDHKGKSILRFQEIKPDLVKSLDQ